MAACCCCRPRAEVRRQVRADLEVHMRREREARLALPASAAEPTPDDGAEYLEGARA
jgi:hypothetical protein